MLSRSQQGKILSAMRRMSERFTWDIQEDKVVAPLADWTVIVTPTTVTFGHLDPDRIVTISNGNVEQLYDEIIEMLSDSLVRQLLSAIAAISAD